ncbi:DinB family protein, partial [Bacillus cereus]|nr:DinB family protein [Bacillus cereus]
QTNSPLNRTSLFVFVVSINLLTGFSFDDMYVLRAAFDKQSMQDLLGNLIVVRQSTLHLLRSLDKEAWSQRGNANNSEVTVHALAYIIAGHELHHLQIIKERYLGPDLYPAT